MLTWIKENREARIALAICAGLLLYKFALYVFETVLEIISHRYYNPSSDDVETIVGWGVIALVIGASVWLWRARRNKTVNKVSVSG